MLSSVARSHLCMGCGDELAHLLAPPDPHYGLPIVVCPGCGLACVRRPRGGAAGWQTFLRAFAAGRRLLLGGGLLIALLALGTVMCSGIASGLDEAVRGKQYTALFGPDEVVKARLRNWWALEGFWIVPVWAGVWATVGLAAGACFPHWRARWWVLGAPALIVTVLLVPIFLFVLGVWARDGTPPLDSFRRDGPDANGALSFLLPLAVGTVLSGAVMPLVQRAGRKLTPTEGLRSKRLARTRKKRSREL